MFEVSVCLTAYNIEKYIAQALDSVLSQKVDFRYEIVVGEDKSTDSTLEILKMYSVKYPNKFRIIENQKNLGMMANYLKTLEACRGKYVAVLDGDDYWTDNEKLQTQFDFLQKNKEYTLCWHDSTIVNSDGEIISKGRFKDRNYAVEFDLKQVVVWKVLGSTSSIFFKNTLSPFSEWAYKLYGTEALLFMLCRQKGKLHYFDKLMSAYRKHGTSMESSFDKRRKSERNINEESILMRALYPKFRTHFMRKIFWNRIYLFYLDLREWRFRRLLKS